MKKFFLILVILSSILLASKVIKIDLSKQKLYAIENGELIFSGNVSTGKDGYRTPRGIYRVLEKKRYHISSKYPEPDGGAKMPYMHRLTNYGIAIHEGYLPGYPASHGCIRVSKGTAKRLWSWSRVGTKVIIYGNASSFRFAKKSSKRYKKYAKKIIKKRVIKKVKKRRVVKRTITKRRYVKKIAKKRYYSRYNKKRYYKRKYVKRRYKRRYYRKYKKRRYRYKRYAKRRYRYRRASNDGYEIIEVYDVW